MDDLVAFKIRNRPSGTAEKQHPANTRLRHAARGHGGVIRADRCVGRTLWRREKIEQKPHIQITIVNC